LKILLYAKNQNIVKKSGVGRAFEHQKRALTSAGIDYTTIETDNHDIVHINTIFPSSLRMAKRARAKGLKVVYHAHSTYEDFRNSFIGSNLLAPLFKRWIIYCYNHGDVILTPTPYAKQLLENYGIEKEIIALSNGIDLKEFTCDKQAGQTFRQKYGFHKDDKIILSVGLQIERKGILDFVALAKSLPEYKFFWCGYTNPKMVPRKVQKAINTKLPNLFFPGYIPRDEMCGVYSGSDLFLFMTHEETEGIVLLEALAMKIPILLRDIAIYQNWLTKDIHVYKDKTLLGFQKQIRTILKKDSPDLTANAYEISKARDIEQIGLQLKEIYRSL